jgi:translation initiation factor IF-1
VIPAAYVYRRAAVNYVKLADGDEVVVQPGEVHDDNGARTVEILSGLVDGDKVAAP